GLPNHIGRELRRKHLLGRAPIESQLIEERRADAHLWTLAYKNAIARLYNRRVRPPDPSRSGT
ncbi:hypothetical protein B296_00000910, partial [Ensete ventricosum]